MSARVPLIGRLAAGIAATALVAGLSIATAPAAAAAVEYGLGHETTPAQPYLGNPDTADWLGSYLVAGKQVWCVQFAHHEPDSDEQYQPGTALKTKWGTDLPADIAADISYLLLRYADTTSPDESAALAHLLHSWTASPQNPGQLDPANDFRHIAYDAPSHLAKLPAAAQTAVQTLTADAAANRGPWTAAVTPPDAPQVIGVAADWAIAVDNAAGTGVADVEVTVTAVDATFTDAGSGEQVTTGTVTTGAEGVTLPVTPAGTAPKIDITLASPAEVPVVQQAVEVDTQRIVSTGGEEELTATAKVTATPPPTTTTTTPQLPSTIPAGDTPDAPIAQAAVEQRISGGGMAALAGVVLVAGFLAWRITRRRVVGRHMRG
jgi:hypothetical protein